MKKKYTFEEVWELAPYLSDKELLEHLKRVDDVMALANRKNSMIREKGETIWGQNDWTMKEEERRIDNDRLQIQHIIKLLQPKVQPNNSIPDCLKTQNAENIKAKFMKAGLLTNDWTLAKHLSITEKVCLAQTLSGAIFNNWSEWKTWEDLWGCSLANNKTKAESTKKWDKVRAEYESFIKP